MFINIFIFMKHFAIFFVYSNIVTNKVFSALIYGSFSVIDG